MVKELGGCCIIGEKKKGLMLITIYTIFFLACTTILYWRCFSTKHIFGYKCYIISDNISYITLSSITKITQYYDHSEKKNNPLIVLV